MKRFVSLFLASLIFISTALPTSVHAEATGVNVEKGQPGELISGVGDYEVGLSKNLNSHENEWYIQCNDSIAGNTFTLGDLYTSPYTGTLEDIYNYNISLIYDSGYLYLRTGGTYTIDYIVYQQTRNLVSTEYKGNVYSVNNDGTTTAHAQTSALVQLYYWQQVVWHANGGTYYIAGSDTPVSAEKLCKHALSDEANLAAALYGSPNSTKRTNWTKNGRKKLIDYSDVIQAVTSNILMLGDGILNTSDDDAKTGRAIAVYDNSDGSYSNLRAFLKAAITAESQRNQDNSNNASQQASSSVSSDASAGSFENWCNAIVALYNNQDIRDKDNYKDPSVLVYTGLSDFQKVELLALAKSWHKDGTDLSNYDNIDMSVTGWTDVNGRVANAQQPDTDAVTSALNDLASIEPTTQSDLYYWMLTSYDRAVLWKTLASANQAELDDVRANMSDLEWYIDNAGDKFYLSAETANIATDAFPVTDLDSFVHYIEISQEIQSYVDVSLDSISRAQDNGEKEKWKKALAALKKCCDYMQMTSMRDVWDDNFQQYYDTWEIGESDGEIGDMSDASEELEAGEPLQMFFSTLNGQRLSDDMITGIAYSAAFVPMRTNMYDPYTMKGWDETFVTDFHYRYGYMRKALYKVDSGDAAQALANTDLVGSKSVCTLRDLINPAGDIVLYLDDNFYNVDDLATLLDKSYNRITNDSSGDQKIDADDDGVEDTAIEKWWTHLTDNISELLDVDISSQVKTGDNTQYSQKLRNRVSNQKNSGYLPDAYIYDESNSAKDESADNEDHIVLTSGQINTYLAMTSNKPTSGGDGEEVYDSYNVLQSYAVVSSVYRDNTLFNYANSTKVQAPVFIASKAVPNSNAANQSERNEIFNWLLLKNIRSQMPIGYSTSLDMDAAVYMDIYGNILTESGTVVVPAAANATLFSDLYYEYGSNMALLYTYGKDYALKDSDVQSVLTSTLSERMEVDEYLNTWKMRSDVFSYEGSIDTLMDTARISIADDDVKQLMQNTFYEYLYTDSHTTTDDVQGATPGYNFYKYVDVVLEVMRGAPIESIDKDFEGLNTARTLTNAGLSAAAKLEVLDEALDENGINSLLAIPNLAFVDGFEYIVLFAFKVIMLVVVLVLMFTLYRDMVGQSLSLQTLFKCIGLVALTCLAIVTVPEAFNISYYQANKLLLQDETEYIAMLNEEKRQNGVEVGVTSITEPDTSTKLLLKLTDMDVPWYDLFPKIMLSNTYKGLDEVYASFAEDNPISQQSDVTIMNDGVYVYVDDLFDSATVDIDPDTGMLDLRTDESTTAAFYTPYYVILEALITDINTYNTNYQWKGYTTTLQSGGRLKSLGACQGYFTDKVFMESEGDILHLHEVYGVADELATYRVWTDDDVALMQKCAWACGYPNGYDRMYKVSDRARKFVADNQNLLGKISDETFLKVMALDIAMYHNSIFGVNSCNAIEIEQLSQDDLCRLMLGTKEEAMYDSSLSYGRYVYEIGNSFAVYLAAAFSLVMFALGFIKPVLSIAIFISIFVSLFVFKVVLRKSTSSVYGYIVTTILLCTCNFGHALSLKLCMWFPDLGLTPAVCVILCTALQLIYVACLTAVAYVALKDWRDLGWARYQYKASQMEVGANELISKFKFKLHIKGSNKERIRTSDVMMSKDGGKKFYENLSDRRNRRKQKYGIG